MNDEENELKERVQTIYGSDRANSLWSSPKRPETLDTNSFASRFLGLEGCHYRAGDKIHLRGEKPVDRGMLPVFEYLNGKTVFGVDYHRACFVVSDFLKLYESKDKRGRPAAPYLSQSPSDVFKSYLTAYYCLRDDSDPLGVTVSADSGSAGLFFKANDEVSSLLRSYSPLCNERVLDYCLGTDAFKVMVEWLGFVNEIDFEEALVDLNFHIIGEGTSGTLSLIYDHTHPLLMGIPLRVCHYLREKGATGKTELAIYFGTTQRQMGYILEQLVARGKVRMNGLRNSPKLTYALASTPISK